MNYCKSNTDIAGSSGEILKRQAILFINTFSKQSLDVELCKVSKGEEKEEVYSCNTNNKI